MGARIMQFSKSEEERRAAILKEGKALFAEADIDQNGSLSKSELKKFLSANENKYKHLFGISTTGYKELYEEMDTDGDANFSEEEFCQCFLNHSVLGFHKQDDGKQGGALRNSAAADDDTTCSGPTTMQIGVAVAAIAAGALVYMKFIKK